MPDFLASNDIIPRAELTGFVRALEFADYNGPGSLERFLPPTRRVVVEWSFDKADRTRARMGRYRPFNAESGLQSRPGFSRINGAIPPMSEKMLLTEEDRVRLNVLAAGGSSSIAAQQIREIIFNDAMLLAEAINARVEYARGQVLRTGKLTMTTDENLPGVEIDYNDGSDAIQTATAGTLWSVKASATPMQNIFDWMATYRAANRQMMPAIGLTSWRVISAMMATDEVKNFFIANGTAPALITEANFSQLLAAHGFPPLVRYDTVVNLNGTDTRVLPDNEILWLPTPDVRGFGETTIGVGSDALDMAETEGLDIAADGPGLTGRAWKMPDPPQSWTRVGGLIVPVLKNPKLIMRTTVLS